MLCAVLVAALGLAALRLSNLLVEPARTAQVVASLPVWHLASGTESIVQQAQGLSGASPQAYEIGAEGEIVPRFQPPGVSLQQELDSLRDAGVPIIPSITNTSDGSWSTERIQRILHDPVLLQQHIDAVVAFVRAEDFAGVDIDIEELEAEDREAFSSYIAQLADALHADDRILAVDVFAKDSDAGYDERNRAQDYAALGRSVDQLRIMAYDYHWSTSTAGPIAPLDWVRSVLQYAVSQVPPEKIVLGLPTYGYSWADGGQEGKLSSWLQAYGASKEFDAPVQWDSSSQSPWLTYTDAQGAQQVVWFENSYSLKAKMDLARSYDVGGVFIWLVGDVDDGIWAVVEDYRGSTQGGQGGGTS
ncbi:MAG TPA: glycosyl hydrolase family 18 protein [Dermatophilaceae bacterium]|nr:glycosyl hydrolase family 18 protein [Dermatophilaceae bacterium]